MGIRLLTRWFRDNKPPSFNDDFPFTSISFNPAYAARRHRDRNNCGPSVLKTFGKFRGGQLRYWPEDSGRGPVGELHETDSAVLNAKALSVAFDGRRAHEVTPFKGKERFSLVFFTVGHYAKAVDKTQQQCKDLGFSWPTSSSLNCAMKV